ncbi:glycine betaine/proline transport system substrate-binding protein [Alkalibacillus filiformis]|uniref:Glycine betaine/proline transport system substrate-binding protein n=1 Tax=Alkalibacillus filiformis TaxID=200990 RepID=A0ABU0DT59_9BACI|nr:ABC transporter substrate-binding protein [Alkalibacillus filiformis]MDQ0351629.1 glycine betaine/proline transport system substrate-binding protein [Alkalibacillus filiformis]
MKKWFSLVIMASLLVLAACGDDDGELEEIVLADADWNSIKVHNAIMQNIMEYGYGFETDTLSGSTPNTVQGLRDGDINVYSEVWTDNIREVYEEAIDAGEIIEVSINFDDNEQGLYVPTYVIEGDEERGIEPLAPGLETVEDLADYPEVFQDPEDNDMGRIVNGPSGWAVNETIVEKIEYYGLDEMYNIMSPGSDAALVSSLASAYESGEPWVGYYWSPTWVTASYDITLLEDNPYDEEVWQETRGTEFPPNDVTVAVHEDFPEQAPEVYEFLQNYETSTALTEEALVHILEEDASPEEAAVYWMELHEDLWTDWVPEDVAESVKEELGI